MLFRSWHNYLMLLWPGVLLLVDGTQTRDPAAPYRPGRAAVLLAVAVIPVSWNALWPAGQWWAVPGRMLYCAVLVAYWWVLLSSSGLRWRGTSRGVSGVSEAPAAAPGSAAGPSTVAERSSSSSRSPASATGTADAS